MGAPVSPQAKAISASLARRLEYATRLLEDAAESGQTALIGHAYAELLLARGEFAAYGQILDLEDTLNTGDVERPGRQLRIVR
jgi:hypothetical protein